MTLINSGCMLLARWLRAQLKCERFCMAITTKEIAEMVGVSRQAVSAVLNGHPEKVSAEKRRKIFHIAKNSQYRPNTAALKLSGHVSRRFAVIDIGLFPQIKLSILENLTELLAENNIDVRLTPPGDKGSKIRALYDGVSDGAAAVVTDLKPELFDVKNFSAPLLIMGNGSEECDISFDYENAVRLTVSHLYKEHQHRKFALISAGKDAISCGRELYRGFEKVLDEFNIGFKPEYCIPMHRQETPSDYAAMLIREHGVSAFLCENDALAVRLMVDLKLRGIDVPRDAAVIGTGCSFISELSSTPLTSIYLPAREYAEKLCDMILARINGNAVSETRQPELVRTGLFIGGSCGCPPAKLPQLYWEAVPHSLGDQEQEICKSDRFEQFMKYVIF